MSVPNVLCTKYLGLGLLAFLLSSFTFLSTTAQPSQPPRAKFPDAHDDPPQNWSGPVFKLSQDYPTQPPKLSVRPWDGIDFKLKPSEYMWAVLEYAFEGNASNDWDVSLNSKRRWFHAPWMHWGNKGREFVRGLTQERPSRPGELHENQTSTFQNWAVSFYNEEGGYTIGQVWKDPNQPNPSVAQFPEGTVSVKLLFTQASPIEVPYLDGSKEWQAHIHTKLGGPDRTVQTLRLLQVDLAVKDKRAADTGWVFATFVWHKDVKNSDVWKRLNPVGLMWGNDPNVTASDVELGKAKIKESWINSALRLPHYGWGGRLNGPVDNPMSSCLSCHSTAQWEARSAMAPPANSSDSSRLRWFRNIAPNVPFDDGEVSLDYSLQLAAGIQHFYTWKAGAEAQREPRFSELGKSGKRVYRVSRDEADLGE